MKEHNLSSLSEEQFIAAVKSDENMNATKELANIFVTDPVYGPQIMYLLKYNQPETRAFVTYVARQIIPSSFLEVGVRRGWSTAAVALASPECEIYAFDQWHANYGGSSNPGPDFVTSELSKFGYNKPINFFDGDSHETLREFFKQNPDIMMDMILVDGDHTVEGAIQDLTDTMPHVAVGGVMIFDDTVDCAGLQGVWDSLADKFPNFKYFSYRDNKPGVSCAVRIE